MAGDTEALVVALEARIRDFERNLQKASGTAARQFGAIERRAKQSGDRLERQLRSSTANINRLLGTLGVGIGFNELRGLAEAWSDISSRVNIAAGDQEKGGAVMERVAQIARRTYSDLGQTAEAFIANSQALKDLGYSTQTQLDYTESLNNALVVSGARGQRAESVMNALSKAMALGELRGDNLNTVVATGGRVAQALADGLGVTVNELRALGQQGKLTSDVVVKALTGELAKLREEADSMPATITDAMVLLKNSLTEYVGRLNEANGVTAIFSDGIILAADNIDSIAAAAAVAGAVLLGRYVPGLVRATAAQAAMIASNPFLLMVTAISAATFALSAFGGEIHPIAGELATLHDYAGAAWDTIRDGAYAAGSTVNDTLVTAINFIAQAIGGAEVSFADLADFAKAAVNQIVGEFSLLYDTIVITFTKLPQAVAEAVINGMNAMIEGVERGLNAVIEAVNSTIEAINGVGGAVGVTLGTIGTVTLGRITNAYEGAGTAAGEAYGQALRDAARDHVGEALGAWRELANERAAARQAASQGGVEIDAVDSPVAIPRPRAAGGGGGGGRGGRGGSGGNDFDRTVAQIQERIGALRAETEARRGLTGSVAEQEAAVERARLRHELLTAAQRAGITITPELEGRINALADAYSAASLEAQALADSQQEAARRAQDIANLGGSLVSGFIADLRAGKSAGEALANALNKVVDQLIDMAIQALIVKPLMSMLGGGLLGFSGGGMVGGGAVPGFADGGHVRGPGGPTDDRIPAMLSNGEFVINAAATRKHRALLEAINTGALPRLAAGGIVGDDGAPLASSIGGTAISVSAPITINGSAGTEAQNEDLAKRMRRELEGAMRGIAVDEMRKQMKPGNIGNRR